MHRNSISHQNKSHGMQMWKKEGERGGKGGRVRARAASRRINHK